MSLRQRAGEAFKPRSHSVKAWARYLGKWGRPQIRVKNPNRYLNSHARRKLNAER